MRLVEENAPRCHGVVGRRTKLDPVGWLPGDDGGFVPSGAVGCGCCCCCRYDDYGRYRQNGKKRLSPKSWLWLREQLFRRRYGGRPLDVGRGRVG